MNVSRVIDLETRRPIGLAGGGEVYPIPGDSVTARTEKDIITIDGYRHELFTSTPAVESDNPPYIMVYPGILEHAAHGIGAKFHKTIARFIPTAHVVGVATDGFGPEAVRYGLGERQQHNLEAMGKSRAAIIEEIVPQEAPILFVVTSMGSIIKKEVARNLSPERISHVTGVVMNATAVVEEGPEDDRLSHFRAFAKFGLSILPDVFVEIAQTPPKRFIGQVLSLVDSGHLSPHDALPLGLLTADIITGSKTADIDYMMQVYHDTPLAVLLGQDDPVGQYHSWVTRREEHPNVSIHAIPGRSHGIVINPVRNARKVVKISYDEQMVSPLNFGLNLADQVT